MEICNLDFGSETHINNQIETMEGHLLTPLHCKLELWDYMQIQLRGVAVGLHGQSLGIQLLHICVTHLCENPFKIEWYIAIINIGVWFLFFQFLNSLPLSLNRVSLWNPDPTGTYYVGQTGFELAVILLPLPLESQDFKYESHHTQFEQHIKHTIQYCDSTK